MTSASILWRRLDQPGHEACRLLFHSAAWHLTGAASFVYQQQPCHLSYAVRCDQAWRTTSATISGWVGPHPVAIEIAVDTAGGWQLNGRDYPDVRGCIDLDLNFSPATNLLPIRRLGLADDQQAEVRAAWLRFPGFSLEPLDQRYRRLDRRRYHYESEGGSFVATLQVSPSGFVTEYPRLWLAEASTEPDTAADG